MTFLNLWYIIVNVKGVYYHMEELATKKMIIYKIENKVNGKVYIGQTVNTFNKRYQGRGVGAERVYQSMLFAKKNNRGYNTHLFNAMNKYGVENFTVEILCQCNTVESLNKKEERYIRKYKSDNQEFGYNTLKGGENKKWSKDAKVRRRESKLNQKCQLDIDGVFEIHITKKIRDVKLAQREVAILLYILSKFNIHNVASKTIKRYCERSSTAEIETIIKILAEKEIIELFSLENGMVDFKTKDKEENSFCFKMEVEYDLELKEFVKGYTMDIDKARFKKCAVCNKHTYLKSRTANNKYCERCAKKTKNKQIEGYKKSQLKSKIA